MKKIRWKRSINFKKTFKKLINLKFMKILLVGLGSIGQRHLLNLKKIYPGAFFFALRKKNKSLVIKDNKSFKEQKA